jgi:hypothetical protein
MKNLLMPPQLVLKRAAELSVLQSRSRISLHGEERAHSINLASWCTDKCEKTSWE